MPGPKRDPLRLNLAHKERQKLAQCMGLVARLEGKGASANPFQPGTQHSTNWGIGWGRPDPNFKGRT